MQVKVFRPTGELVRAIGKAGGRPYGGRWATMKEDLLLPTVPAVTADGTLYVGEDAAPKRVAIFKDGRWADEWIGPLASGCGKMDVADEAQPRGCVSTVLPVGPGPLSRRLRGTGGPSLDAVWGYEFSLRPLERPSRYARGSSPTACTRVAAAAATCGIAGAKRFCLSTAVPCVFRSRATSLFPCAAIGTLVQVDSAAGATRWPAQRGLEGPARDRPLSGHAGPVRVPRGADRQRRLATRRKTKSIGRLPPGGKEELAWADSTLHGRTSTRT